MESYKYAVIVFKTEQHVQGTGEIYGWYESLATALNTATNLQQFGTVFSAVVVKLV